MISSTVQPLENLVDSNTSFQIAETFNSLQGEGAHTGEYSTFIRFNACNLKCPFCFIGETLIKTINGDKRIDLLKVGDLVYSNNHSTNTIELKKILKLYKNTSAPEKLMKLITSNNKVLFPTDEHPFYSKKDKKYIPAKDLKCGDSLVFENDMIDEYVESVGYLNNDQLAQIDSVNGYRTSVSDPINVYNIEVEDNNNYFAGGILVHNCDTQDVMTHGKYKFTSDELIKAVETTSNIVFTGGEPTLPKYRLQMVEMIDIVLSEVVGLNRITTETNGVYLMQWVDTLHSRYPHIKKDYSFSPKYYDQTVFENTLVYMQNIKNNYKKVSNSNIICKVVLDPERTTEFETICNQWLKVFPKHTLYIMAMGDTVEKLKKSTTQALEYQSLYNCSFSPRLHIELGLK